MINPGTLGSFQKALAGAEQTPNALLKFLQKMGGGADAAGKTGIGLGGRAAKGLKEHPVVAGLGAGAGYGASEAMDEDEDGITKLLAMLGLG